jgi:steroid 5-alpha reductase family enzyme
MLSPFDQVLIVICCSLAFMLGLWLIQQKTRDAGIVDVGWTVGLGLAALFYAWSSGGDPVRRFVLGLVAGTWSFRLAFYLLKNRILKGTEDGRYQELRSRWGSRSAFNFLLFFLFQAILIPLFSIPFLLVAHNHSVGLSIFDWLGIAVWLLAISGEAISDAQLARFRADASNRGKVCAQGLWRYSRHPNYFFEWLHWWSYVLLSVGNPWWIVSLWGPTIMLVFLFKITGIPATEERALASRGDEYRRYQQTTSQFFPWFPKEAGS